MATCNLLLQPPSTFNFATPNKWPKWKRRFEQFRIASGLLKRDDTTQRSTLLYCLGEDTASILTNISADDARIYSKVLDKLDSVFEARKNTLERPQEVLSKRNIDTLYLDTIGDNSAGSPKAWKVNLVVHNKEISFKLDTGAEVTAITGQTYQLIGSPRLQKCEQ